MNLLVIIRFVVKLTLKKIKNPSGKAVVQISIEKIEHKCYNLW